MPLTMASFHFVACSPSPSTAAIIGVLVGPGQMAFKRTFLRASSRASDLVKEIRPPLQAEYTASSLVPTRAASEAILMILPPPRSAIKGAIALWVLRGP